MACFAFAIIGASAISARADDRDKDKDDKNRHHEAIPFEFVGRTGDCGTITPTGSPNPVPYPPGSHIVTGAWLSGMGLPDNGGQNTTATDLFDNPNKRDPHFGLLLNKNGPTADCSSAGARITGTERMTVGPTFELGFDYRNGTHCGAGAPRFNITTENGTREGQNHFLGCAAGTQTPAPQDPLQWTRVRFAVADATQAFPPLAPGDRIRSIEIIYDEGTDAPSLQDPNGVGLSVLDNIDINGDLITRGPESCGARERRGGD